MRKNNVCNILVFDYTHAKNSAELITKEEAGRGRKQLLYRFYDSNRKYICEALP